MRETFEWPAEEVGEPAASARSPEWAALTVGTKAFLTELCSQEYPHRNELLLLLLLLLYLPSLLPPPCHRSPLLERERVWRTVWVGKALILHPQLPGAPLGAWASR